MGNYVALDYAIENKDQVDKLVLIDSSGMLNEPTELLEDYLKAALELNYFLRYKKVNKVFEELLADASKHFPSKTIAFTGIIDESGAKHAFESGIQIVQLLCLI